MHGLISVAARNSFEHFRAPLIRGPLYFRWTAGLAGVFRLQLHPSAVICSCFGTPTSSRRTSIARVLHAVITFARSARKWLTAKLSLYNGRMLTEAFLLQTQRTHARCEQRQLIKNIGDVPDWARLGDKGQNWTGMKTRSEVSVEHRKENKNN